MKLSHDDPPSIHCNTAKTCHLLNLPTELFDMIIAALDDGIELHHKFLGRAVCRK